MLKAVFRQVFRQLLVLFLLLATIGLVGASWINQEIFSPPRRALQDYHQERLQNPAAFGLQIRRYSCLDGKAPCLLVEPDANAGAGKRGKILRKQLAAKGIALPAYGKVRGIIVLLHGRNGRKEDLLPVAERFVAAGFRCLLPDLPGHGDSPLSAMAFGTSEFEHTLPRRLLADAREHFNLPAEPAVLWGLSMGGAFAISAATESPDTWNALTVVSSFARLDQVLRLQIPPQWREASAVLQPFMDMNQWLGGQPAISKMQPQQWAQQVSLPALVVHGENDVFVPPSQGEKLYAAFASTDKRWISVPEGGHANVLATAMPLYAEMTSWLLETLPAQQIANRQ